MYIPIVWETIEKGKAALVVIWKVDLGDELII